ncbi:MAG: cytochrome o ubiquinol oxidase subunit III [Methylotetracoccus sp.]
MSDGVLFSLLFVTYATMSRSFAGGPTGRELFDLGTTGIETALLLASSLSCGFVMLSVEQRSAAHAIGWLVVTFVLGLGFVGMELAEFQRMIGLGAGPGRSAYLSSFFTLVGTHGVHVTVGLIWLAVMIAQIHLKGLKPAVRSRLARWSLFWHFLDLVWIGIFSVVYLPGVV